MGKFKLSLPVTILLASIILGGFFYASQVSKQKSIEKQQQIEIEQKKQEQLTKESREQQAKEGVQQALNTCIADAEERYSNNWDRECKSRGELTSACVELKDLSFSEYLKKYNLTAESYNQQRDITDQNPYLAVLDYAKRRDECSCRLPTVIADGIGDDRDRLKDECFKRYPQN